MLGDLGHGLPEPARVLLGHEHGHAENARSLHEHGGVVGDGVELPHRVPERLLDVDDHERGAVALQRATHAATSSGAPARWAIAPPASVRRISPRTVRPSKAQCSERLW